MDSLWSTLATDFLGGVAVDQGFAGVYCGGLRCPSILREVQKKKKSLSPALGEIVFQLGRQDQDATVSVPPMSEAPSDHSSSCCSKIPFL